jgi:hypothetical protein
MELVVTLGRIELQFAGKRRYEGSVIEVLIELVMKNAVVLVDKITLAIQGLLESSQQFCRTAGSIMVVI